MSAVSSVARRARRSVQNRVASRYRLRGEIDRLDPAIHETEIARLIGGHEFPWGTLQSLSFALFRTYAAPSIGDLLHDTGQFTTNTQKRYDDTTLLLEAPLELGFDDATARTAIRRVNQMHAMYDISNEDMLYVLATFIVCPIHWINTYEWRKLTRTEIVGLTNYYRKLGKHMAIKDMPETFEDWEHFYEEYEKAHFAFSPKSLAVADATLDLLGTFMPYRLLPRAVVRRMSFALMDDRLLDAFDYAKPTRAARVLVRGGLKARGLAIRLFARPRTEPWYVRQSSTIRGYPNGYRVEELGTFAPGCPAPRRVSPVAAGCPVPHAAADSAGVTAAAESD